MEGGAPNVDVEVKTSGVRHDVAGYGAVKRGWSRRKMTCLVCEVAISIFNVQFYRQDIGYDGDGVASM